MAWRVRRTIGEVWSVALAPESDGQESRLQGWVGWVGVGCLWLESYESQGSQYCPPFELFLMAENVSREAFGVRPVVALGSI